MRYHDGPYIYCPLSCASPSGLQVVTDLIVINDAYLERTGKAGVRRVERLMGMYSKMARLLRKMMILYIYVI